MWIVIYVCAVVGCCLLLGSNATTYTEEEQTEELKEQAVFLDEWAKKHRRTK
jgi:hypothetical protein